MNANMKSLNNTAPPVNISSFISAPINNIKNTANNIGNSIKNTFNNVVSTDISEPINNSFNATIQNTPIPFVSIPVILSLGIFIILFILFIVFREQLSIGFEFIWNKIKELFGFYKPSIKPIPSPEFTPDMQMLDNNVIDKLLPGRKEVFNIAENKYTYSDAEPLCKAFGAELATYDQVKEAWEKGADWCNYGWVKGQTALYPTQESTFNKLQSGTEDQRMSCGFPGINGGYFDNPELRFGVNCYGSKPSENEADLKAIMAQSGDLTPEALQYDKKVLDYKAQMGQIPVNPFKSGVWSE